MDLSLSPEQQKLQERAREFARNVVAPKAAYHDKTGEFPREICQQAWKEGLMNTHVPKEYGGIGLGVLDGCIVGEEIAAACSGIGTAMEANTLAEAPVIVAGNDDQKKRFLTPLCKNFGFAAYAVTEPEAGSDVARIQTIAKKVGDKYVINGTKWWITNGGVASWYFVLARTEGGQGYQALTGFLVPADTPGITRGPKEMNLGQRASNTVRLMFEDVAVPKENLLGNEGEGFKIAMAAFDHTRPPVAAGAVGVARSALEHALNYARRRKAFGRSILSYQGINFKLADMAMEIEAARFLVWQAAWLIDHGQRNTKQAAMAKAYAADICMRATVDAVQVFGGYGYSQEYPVEKLMRDAKIYQIYEGTSQIQRSIIVGELMRGR
ncbi:MAG: acyl-CoA dehydrogenase family protein [Candidatus Omnitrophica bacterium]|nr:acyl-CoA dehydrogenase family protein [Candidatus Omnitrophota bacterium]